MGWPPKQPRTLAPCLPNAVVYKLEHDDTGRIAAAHYFDPTRKSFRVTGKTFILAANGIESPKLLLLSASPRYPTGLANRSDMVGRNLMDHPSTSLDFDAAEEVWLGRGPQFVSSIQTFRDGPERSRRTGYRLDFANDSRVLGSTQALITEGVFGAAFDKRLRFSAAHEMSVKNVPEVLPHPDNRVTLSNKTDFLGIAQPQLHFKIDDYTKAGVAESRVHFEKIAVLMGGTNLRFNDNFSNNQHICGTVSMGLDPKTSVVDQFGRSHDHENLFMVGTGVLPTSATCNSTLTAVAVALRTAQHILPRPEAVARSSS